MGGIAASAVVVGACVVEVVQMKEETARRKEANETARRRHREEQETARRNAREAEETARRREAEETARRRHQEEQETARRRHQEEQETIRLSEITFRRILPDGNIYEMTLRGLRGRKLFLWFISFSFKPLRSANN